MHYYDHMNSIHCWAVQSFMIAVCFWHNFLVFLELIFVFFFLSLLCSWAKSTLELSAIIYFSFQTFRCVEFSIRFIFLKESLQGHFLTHLHWTHSCPTGVSFSFLLCGISCSWFFRSLFNLLPHSGEASSSRFLRKGMWEVQFIETLNF